MEIRASRNDDTATLALAGALDATWSEAVEREVEKHVREGARQVVLECAAVPFASSAGLGALLRMRSQINALGGSLVVRSPSEPLRRILAMSKIDSLLIASAAPIRDDRWRDVEHAAAKLQVRRLGAHRYSFSRRSGRISTSARTLIVGVGALGHDEQAAMRAGELVAIGGMAATLPPAGARADFLADAEQHAAPLTLVDAAVIEGQPALHARFEAVGRGVPFAEILRWLVATIGGPTACVISGEIEGVIGMAARLAPGSPQFADAIRNPAHLRQAVLWFGEPAFAGDSLHAVAIAMPEDGGRGDPAVTRTPADFMRPMGPGLLAHAHAAVTSFRAIRLDEADPARAVSAAAQDGLLRTVVHLVRDGRSQPAHETLLRRGVIWAAPLEERIP